MTTRALTARILIVAGLALFAAGLVLGFLPKTAAGVNCGSAFHASTDAQVADFGATLTGSFAVPPLGGYAAACADARSGAKAPAVGLLVVGGVLAAAGGVAALPSTGHRVRRTETAS